MTLQGQNQELNLNCGVTVFLVRPGIIKSISICNGYICSLIIIAIHSTTNEGL